MPGRVPKRGRAGLARLPQALNRLASGSSPEFHFHCGGGVRGPSPRIGAALLGPCFKTGSTPIYRRGGHYTQETRSQLGTERNLPGPPKETKSAPDRPQLSFGTPTATLTPRMRRTCPPPAPLAHEAHKCWWLLRCTPNDPAIDPSAPRRTGGCSLRADLRCLRPGTPKTSR